MAKSISLDEAYGGGISLDDAYGVQEKKPIDLAEAYGKPVKKKAGVLETLGNLYAQQPPTVSPGMIKAIGDSVVGGVKLDVRLLKRVLGGAQGAVGEQMKSLLKVADYISDKLGITKSNAARMIAEQYSRTSESNKASGLPGVVGDIAEGIGGAIPTALTATTLGPAGLAVQGGVTGLAQGGVKGALAGAAQGALSQAALGGAAGLPRLGRIGANAAFGAAATPGGVKERATGAATLGIMGAMGKNPEKGIVDLRAKINEIKATKNIKKFMESPPETAGAVPTTGEAMSPSETIVRTLKALKPISREQKLLRTIESRERIGKAVEAGEGLEGEAWLYASLKELEGKMPKVEFEQIRSQVGEKSVVGLMNQIKESDDLLPFEKIRAGVALAKLLNKDGVIIPQENEMGLLNRVYGAEFTNAILSNRPNWELFKGIALSAANLPRSLMASFDLSAPLRQGIFTAASHPAMFLKNTAKSVGMAFNEDFYNASMKEIGSRPNYKYMQRDKVPFSDLSTKSTRGPIKPEEVFAGLTAAEKLPIIGRGVRASARAYSGFLNKQRADLYDYLFKAAEKSGLDPGLSKVETMIDNKVTQLMNAGLTKKEASMRPELLDLYQQWENGAEVGQSISKFVGDATGRGTMQTFSKSGMALNALLFSPRLMMSRLNLLNPVSYMKQPSVVRKEYLKSWITMAGAGATIAGAAKALGAKVETNPASPDFAKIRIGNTRIDIWGGFSQYFRAAYQIFSGKTKSTITGKTVTAGKDFKAPSRLEIAQRFLEYKTAPVVSLAMDILRGGTAFGEPLDIKNELATRVVPMVVQDAVDLYKEDPNLFPLSALGIFGVGLQTYKRGPRKKKTTELPEYLR